MQNIALAWVMSATCGRKAMDPPKISRPIVKRLFSSPSSWQMVVNTSSD
jgi:hypothetical protein